MQYFDQVRARFGEPTEVLPAGLFTIVEPLDVQFWLSHFPSLKYANISKDAYVYFTDMGNGAIRVSIMQKTITEEDEMSSDKTPSNT